MRTTFKNDVFQLGFCVYKIRVEGNVYYIGMCKHTQLFELPDAWKNDIFKENFKHALEFEIEIIYSDRDETICEQVQKFHITLDRPDCNIYGKTAFKKRRVKCLQTHKEFESLKAAAEYANVNQSSMSKHLTGVKGYSILKGLTFERII